MDLHIFSIILLIIPLVVNGASTCDLTLFESRLTQLTNESDNWATFSDNIHTWTHINNKYRFFMMPRRGKCIGNSLYDKQYLEVCSSPPQRLYVSRGKDTSLVSFTKKGTPHTTYHECARYVYKKVTKSGYDDTVWMCSGHVEHGAKVIDSSDFGVSSLRALKSYNKLVDNLACSSNWDIRAGRSQLNQLYETLT